MATKKTKQVKRPARQPTPKRPVKPPKVAAKGSALKDAFGFWKDTKAHEFGKMLARENGASMKQVQAAAWNTKHASFYNLFHKLEKLGLATKGKDGQMVATGKARQGGTTPAKA